MSDRSRTFTICDGEPMHGSDIKEWQKDVKALFAKMSIHCPIKIDGIYGQATRSFTAELCYADGLTAKTAMKRGVTPELRVKLRHGKLTDAEKKAKASQKRKDYRATLRKRWDPNGVHSPVAKILADSWGWHPGIHDGLDVICLPAAPIFAMCKAKVIDVRAGGWWGLGAPTDPVLKAKGDGIIQIEVLETVGPFKKGMHIGYGHAEGAVVKVGQHVQPGQHLGHAGFANAWHVHLMVNNGSEGTRGVGTQEPRPLLDYAVKNG